jgi:hypothetical protein
MILFLRRFHDQVVKMLLYAAAVASVIFDRVYLGGDTVELIAADSQSSPQQMLVRLATVMIAGSLSMLALGYSAGGDSIAARGG